MEDASLLALLLTRDGSSSEEVFKKFEDLRRDRVEKIVVAGRRQKSNKTAVSTIGMCIRNVFISVALKLMMTERLIGKTWRYRIDWDEPNIDLIIKYWKADGKS